ncbi:protein serine/threonine phosphatase 2C [Neoconidiobolus thromboides FSU 785]|nr:protein serine/threonine phosphatase 2C [Neoconidiobolus thromboides FSU 785]
MIKLNQKLATQSIRALKSYPTTLNRPGCFNRTLFTNIKNLNKSNNASKSYNVYRGDQKKVAFLPLLFKFSVVTLVGATVYYVYNLSQIDASLELEGEEAGEKRERKQKIQEKLKDITPISEEKADFLLNENQNQISIDLSSVENPITSKLRIYSNQVASNSPIEDRFFISSSPENNQIILGVFDGHSGFNCSEFVSKKLPSEYNKIVSPFINSVSAELLDRVTAMNRIEDIQKIIKQTFLSVDNQIVFRHKSNKFKLGDLLPGINGSCAIMASVDVKNGHVFVSNTGDCRAVIGRLTEDGRWRAVPLSTDHITQNPSEFSRILKLHPGEEDTVIKRDRILGSLQPTRAFGDARYKWSIEDHENIYQKVLPNPKPMPKNYLSPPYVTAEPDVSYHKFDPRKDRFIVLATDGLYDELTNQQIVELVGDHLVSPPDSKSGKDYRKKANTTDIYNFKDLNLSTHLIRNALNDCPLDNQEGTLLRKLLALQAPKSRRYRDDITVLVVTF